LYKQEKPDRTSIAEPKAKHLLGPTSRFIWKKTTKEPKLAPSADPDPVVGATGHKPMTFQNPVLGEARFISSPKGH